MFPVDRNGIHLGTRVCCTTLTSAVRLCIASVCKVSRQDLEHRTHDWVSTPVKRFFVFGSIGAQCRKGEQEDCTGSPSEGTQPADDANSDKKSARWLKLQDQVPQVIVGRGPDLVEGRKGMVRKVQAKVSRARTGRGAEPQI